MFANTPSPSLNCGHAGLEGSRRSVVLSAFTGLDKEGNGAVPVGTAMLAFNADAYPPVATGERVAAAAATDDDGVRLSAVGHLRTWG